MGRGGNTSYKKQRWWLSLTGNIICGYDNK